MVGNRCRTIGRRIRTGERTNDLSETDVERWRREAVELEVLTGAVHRFEQSRWSRRSGTGGRTMGDRLVRKLGLYLDRSRGFV